jgi:hypothetical protein
LEFELEASQLAHAINAALAQGRISDGIFAPWPYVAAQTEALWLSVGQGGY